MCKTTRAILVCGICRRIFHSEYHTERCKLKSEGKPCAESNATVNRSLGGEICDSCRKKLPSRGPETKYPGWKN